jgi:hypothetical protein
MELHFNLLVVELVMVLLVGQVVEQLMALREAQEIHLQLLLHKEIMVDSELTLARIW